MEAGSSPPAAWPRRWIRRSLVGGLLLALCGGGGALAYRQTTRYRVSEEMTLPIREFTNREYPEDPAPRSVQHGRYHGRRLRLLRRDDTHFDFVFEPLRPGVATVAFRNVDVSLLTPAAPASATSHPGNLRIALTDRQWNRQQVAFSRAPEAAAETGAVIEVTGGDGFEERALSSAELAKNCLNAGLWEVLLYTQESDGKALYYQAWFTFPLGHYQALFERGTGLDFTDHWYYLEHWFDPAGTVVDLAALRTVSSEREAEFEYDPREAVLAAGEQIRKRRTTLTPAARTWEELIQGPPAQYASFIPPGRYSNQHPWGSEYRRITRLDRVSWRDITPTGASPGDAAGEHFELELRFIGSDEQPARYLVSGLKWDDLPVRPMTRYHEGDYRPMGIGVPPFMQGYADLQARPPVDSPYFSLLLDARDAWIDHHRAAIDGQVLHRDEQDPDLLHLYLLSYERHSLVLHVMIRRPAPSAS
jgi:hypothetical protein